MKALKISNMYPTWMTDKNDLMSFIKKLYPSSTNKELIRLGPKGDGGYLIPNDLNGIKACFSPGVSFESGFEKDCAELGMNVFLADKSVEGPASEHNLFCFTKKFVGAISNDEFMTLDDWVNSSTLETSSDLLIQIDIQGYEYEVFLSTSECLMKRFRIIVVEFHQLDQLWNRPFFYLVSRSIEKVLKTHTCVHIHPNNCCGSINFNGLQIPRVMEFTFLRNDRIESSSYQKIFPNQLDHDNTNNPTLVLPNCWYCNE